MGEIFPRNHRRALLRLGFECNNDCAFCHSSDRRETAPALETGEAAKRIARLAKSGARSIIFTGGEPTISKDFFTLVNTAGALGLAFGLITNGRMFYYKDFARRAAEAGLEYALVSLHGHNTELHDHLTGAESFKQTIAGLENIAATGCELVVNTVLTANNASHLHEIAAIVSRFAPVKYKISLPEPRGLMMKNSALALSPDKAAAALRSFQKKFTPPPGMTIGIDGATPCIIDDFFGLNDDFYSHGIRLMFEADETAPVAPDHGIRVFHDNCRACSYAHLCPGMYSAYYEWFPDFAPQPLKESVSNAIRFDLEDNQIAKSKKAACDAAAALPGDPDRCIALKRGSKLDVFSTHERYTLGRELRVLKSATQQVYELTGYESSTPYYPSHLKKLSRMAECEKCARAAFCCGVFENADDSNEKILETEIRKIFASLRGRVFEAGCGPGPYFDEIKAAMAEGRVEKYLGIDPELPRFEGEAFPKGFELRKAAIEDFAWRGGKFDCALFFRSWDHLDDVGAALESIGKLLKLGGRLIIVEDSRHIELQSVSEAPPGGQGCSGFEHMRNHTAALAADILRARGYRIETMRPAAADTHCVWIAVAEKR